MKSDISHEKKKLVIGAAFTNLMTSEKTKTNNKTTIVDECELYLQYLKKINNNNNNKT
jgi:hypothetical protein